MINKENLEIEFKSEISKEVYEKMMTKLEIDVSMVKTQINHYFDTEDYFFLNHHIVLRIRQKGNQYKLTSKTPLGDAKLEKHVFLEKEQALDMLEKGFDASIIDLPFQVEKVAELTTERVKLPYKSGYLFLDKSTYYGNIDYEIEYEADDATRGEKEFNEILNEFNITYKKLISKSRRAYLRHK